MSGSPGPRSSSPIYGWLCLRQVLLAGLAALPTELSKPLGRRPPWQVLTHITLPLLKPVIAIIVVIRLADAFRIFDVVYILTGERPRQPDRRALDFHLPADVHGFRFRRRGGRIDPSGDCHVPCVPDRRVSAARPRSRRLTCRPSAGGVRRAAARRRCFVLLVAVSVLFLAPIFWIFSTSFKPSAEIMATPATLLPQHDDAGALFGGAVRGLSHVSGE